MTTNHYDVIVVGARCAGSPTAMLLARQGYRVLLADRATFPSDTISTDVIHPTGIAALNRWGLLDQLLSTGCPPVGTYAFDFGPFTIAGSPGTDDSPVAAARHSGPFEEEEGALPCPAYVGSSLARAADQAASRCCATRSTWPATSMPPWCPFLPGCRPMVTWPTGALPSRSCAACGPRTPANGSGTR